MVFQHGSPRSMRSPDPMPPAPVAESAPIALGSVTVPLSRPLVTHRGDVHEITLRAPTFGDFIDLGEVTRMFAVPSERNPEEMGQVELKVDRAAVMRWAVRLSGHDQVILSTLSANDAQRLMAPIVQLVAAFTKAAAGN